MRKRKSLLGAVCATVLIIFFMQRCGAFEVLDEASGLTASAKHPGVFWSLNDSGGDPILYAINEQREILAQLHVASAENVDWEAVTSDGDGFLYIGDVGNNNNERRDLTIYRVPEPETLESSPKRLSVQAEAFRFRYLEQTAFPDDDQLNFDAEALFFHPGNTQAQGRLYLLTKHRSDTRTNLYVFETLETGKTLHPKRVDTFDVGGQEHWFGGRVTGAALHRSGHLLAVLTYHRIYVFRVTGPNPRLNDVEASVELKQTTTQQVEGIAWQGNSLLVVNEQGDAFRLPQSLWNAENARFPKEE